MNKLIILITINILLLGCTTQNQKITINDKSFNIEIADNPAERAKGLMFRKDLDKDSGMLFIFPNSEKHSFWMKNTFIPLDIIWIDENFKIVYIYENAQPCRESCNSITPNKDAKYVLEINAGLADKYKFEIGDKAEII
ncbi:DUF192 domain-containing protein [Candidatus Woesearchaeota archaeon]|nr:DUF192 domain-containing protein [Candidatus Woesearchaeota archaeon]